MHGKSGALLWRRAFVALCVGSLLVQQPVFAASLVVSNNNNTGPGSLAEAIDTANSNGEADTITFSVIPFDLDLDRSLPEITEDDLTIDGSTGAFIDGADAPFNAFVIDAAASVTIRNIFISNVNYGVLMSGGSGHSVEDCTLISSEWPIYMDTTTGNSVTGSGVLNNEEGIRVQDSSNNTIGGSGLGDPNRISGNGGAAGIFLRGSSGSSNSNLIQGNVIGLNSSGDAAQGNAVGITIFNGVANTIGGTNAGEANFISGNTVGGIWVRGSATQNNEIYGNFIGTGTDEVSVVANANNGIFVFDVADRTRIGGPTTAHGNVIVGSANGVTIDLFNSRFNQISRNSIFDNLLKGINLTNNGNSGISEPTLLTPDPVTGTSPVDGTVELFVDDADQGELFVDSVTATGGTFSSTVDLSAFEGQNLTAVLTDTNVPGNSSEFSAPILIDVTDPTGLLVIGPEVVTDPVVSMNVGASDNFSLQADIDMRFSNDGGVTWSPWEPYASVKTWDLNQDAVTTDDGIRTVTLQVRDEAGNVGADVTETVELDTTGPQVDSVALLEGSPTTVSTVRYQIQFDEPVVGLETGPFPATDDFDLTVSGAKALTGTQITGISDDGGNQYTVVIDTGTGDGLIDLELLDTGGMEDDHGNAFDAGQALGQYVIDRLRFTLQPVGGTPTEFESFTFEVATEGGIGPVSYVWKEDGIPIPDSFDAPIYTIDFLTLEDTGRYTVDAIDDYITVESDFAGLIVQVAFPAASGFGLGALTLALAGAGVWLGRRRKQ